MSEYAATLSRRLPRGWTHLALQFAIWIGFYFAYQLVRGAADRDVLAAFNNGRLDPSTSSATSERSSSRPCSGSSRGSTLLDRL